MSNVKISALPEYSGNPTGGYSVLNNSGETVTYKVRNYNLFGANNTPGGDFPFFVGSGNTAGTHSTGIVGIGNNIIGGSARGDNGGNMAVGYNNTNTDPYAGNSLVVGASNNGNSHNGFVFGQFNSVPYGYAGMVGGYSNTSTNEGGIIVSQNGTISGFNNAMLGGRYNQLLGYAGGIGGTENNGMLGGYYNNLTGGIQSSIIGGQYNVISGQQYGDLDRCYYSSIMGGNNNTIGQYVTGSTIIGSSNSTISASSGTTENSGIYGGKNNLISLNKYSHIIGGSGNTITSASGSFSSRNLILNSIDCAIEKDGQYSSINVNYIGCENVKTENINDVTFINVKNYVRENGGIATGTTVFQNTYTLGANLFQATTYSSTGATNNIVIDPLQQTYVNIDCDGSSTYNIDFTFIDSAIYTDIRLYINYVSGSTINFVGSGSTQWRWAGGVAPVFSGTNRNIIVVSTWANNDVWEVSRSMYM